MAREQPDLLADIRLVTITYGLSVRSEPREWYACLECGVHAIDNEWGRTWLRCAPCMGVSDDHVFEEYRFKHCDNRWTIFDSLPFPWITAYQRPPGRSIHRAQRLPQ